MSNPLLYGLVSSGTLVVLFMAGCFYVLVSDSDDEDNDCKEDAGWK
jgi:hypothetical protein